MKEIWFGFCFFTHTVMGIAKSHKCIEGNTERDYKRMYVKINAVPEYDKYTEVYYKRKDPVWSYGITHKVESTYYWNKDKYNIYRSYPCIKDKAADEQNLPLISGIYLIIDDQQYANEYEKANRDQAHL